MLVAASYNRLRGHTHKLHCQSVQPNTGSEGHANTSTHKQPSLRRCLEHTVSMYLEGRNALHHHCCCLLSFLSSKTINFNSTAVHMHVHACVNMGWRGWGEEPKHRGSSIRGSPVPELCIKGVYVYVSQSTNIHPSPPYPPLPPTPNSVSPPTPSPQLSNLCNHIIII